LALIGALIFSTAVAQTRPAPAAATASAPTSQQSWMAVLLEGKKLGYARVGREVANGTVTTTNLMVLSIRRLGTEIKVTQRETTVETPEGKPISFGSDLDMSLSRKAVRGTVGRDGTMSVITGDAGQPRATTQPYPAGALMNEGLRLLGLQKGLEEGTRYACQVFMPSELKAVTSETVIGPKSEVDLLGRVVELTEAKTTTHINGTDLTTVSYLDADGEAQKSVIDMMGMTLELVACTREYALSESDPADFFNRFLLAAPAGMADPAKAKSAVYVLKPNAADGKLTVPDTASQTVKANADGTYTVTVVPVEMPKDAKRPYAGKDAAALAAMKPSKEVQSDDEKVMALAKTVGETAPAGAADAAEAARKIETFVRKYINKKDLSVGYASATEVARTRQGDCTEHAVLLAALCRASGIPAQVVMGVAYVKQFGSTASSPPSGGGKAIFGPHAWVRAYVGDRWVDLDAALGYDAGHIALGVGNGDMDDFFGMIKTLGAFTITKAEMKE
jgi:hypothetical protein